MTTMRLGWVAHLLIAFPLISVTLAFGQSIMGPVGTLSSRHRVSFGNAFARP